ncbi:MAG: hypothetical protein ABH878_02160, partial [bacterium]
PLEHAKAICREIIRRNLVISWGAYHQDQSLDAEYIALARESGCREFYFSPDAATPEGLRILNKSTTVASLHRSLDLIIADGKAKAAYNFFATVPGTGWKNTFAALRFLFIARRRLGRRLIRYRLSYLRIEPNTPLAETVFGKGLKANTDLLLPETLVELNRLFFCKGDSRLQSAVLGLHFWLGKRFSRKNVLNHAHD